MPTDEGKKTGNNTPQDGGGEGNAVTFDDKQQERVNEIVRERLARQEKALKEQFDGQLKQTQEQLQQQIEELKTSKKPTKKDGEGGEGAADTAAAIKQAIEEQFKELLATEKQKARLALEKATKAEQERETYKLKAYNVQKEVALRKAASEAASFYNVEEVLELTGSKVEWDEESASWVVKENGVIRQNSELKPLGLVEFYQEWAAKRPHFVNGDVKGGAGSSEGKGGKSPANKPQYRSDLKTPAAISDFITKYGYEEYEKLQATRPKD